MRNYLKPLLIILAFPGGANAGELWDQIKEKGSEIVTSTKETAKTVIEDTQNKLADPTSRQIRENASYGVNLAISPFHVPFPMAWGINGNYIASGNWIFGFEYLNSDKAIKVFSFEVGAIKERHLTLQAQRFFGNSFNLKFGVGQRTTEAQLASNLFDLATHSYSETVSKFKTNYARIGLGNQWQFKKKYSFIVDWMTVNIPVSGEVVSSASKYASSASSQKDIENSENVLKYYPSGSFLQFEMGVVF